MEKITLVLYSRKRWFTSFFCTNKKNKLPVFLALYIDKSEGILILIYRSDLSLGFRNAKYATYRHCKNQFSDINQRTIHIPVFVHKKPTDEDIYTIESLTNC
jgi:hypothetical protein